MVQVRILYGNARYIVQEIFPSHIHKPKIKIKRNYLLLCLGMIHGYLIYMGLMHGYLLLYMCLIHGYLIYMDLIHCYLLLYVPDAQFIKHKEG